MTGAAPGGPSGGAGAARPVFDGRASAVLLLLLGTAAVAVALGALVPSATVLPLRIAAAACAAATAVGMLALSLALERRRPWAPPAAAAALATVVVVGLGRTAGAVAAGGIWLPLDAVAAVWALAARGRPAPLPRGAAAGTLALLVVAGRVGEPALAAAFRPGATPLAVGADALELRLAVVCGGGSGMPAEIRVRAAWSWRSADPWPEGPDAIGIGWMGDGAAAARFRIAGSAGTGPGIAEGAAGPAGSLVARDLEGAAGGATWRAGPASAGAGGAVELVLVPLDPPGARPADGRVRFGASYAHLDRWSVAAAGSCSW